MPESEFNKFIHAILESISSLIPEFSGSVKIMFPLPINVVADEFDFAESTEEEEEMPLGDLECEVRDVSESNPAVMSLLTDIELCDRCRYHHLFGSLVLVVFVLVCNKDKEAFRHALDMPKDALKDCIHSIPKARGIFTAAGHMYG